MESKVRRCIALTFDDGPSPYTIEILKILDQYRIKATFFVTGESLEHYPEILKEIVTRGHAIGNHTWNHPDITQISSSELTREIMSLNKEIKEITHIDIKFFRPPYGRMTKENLEVIIGFDLMPILWDIDTNDWDVSRTDPIQDRVMENLKEQSIILMHDGGGPRDKTVNDLPKVIESLRKESYEFFTLDDYIKEVYKETPHD